MKKTLTIKGIIDLNNGIQSINNWDSSILKSQPDKWVGLNKNLVYALVKTKNFIKGEIEAITAMEALSPEIQEFENKRIELAKLYAKKDSNGDPILTNNSYQIEKDKIEVFNSELLSLTEPYKIAIGKWDVSKKEVQEKLKEQVEVEISVVSMDLFPNTIPMDIFEMLAPMLNETNK